jgi:valyl-tRNA synthetase
MVMAGLEFMNEVPFDDVVLHGTVRDAKGRKMSKSLGNAINPLEVIQEYGADALRFSLILNSGQDIFISKDKFEIGRNFANKLWNASRFVQMNVKPEAKVSDLSSVDVARLDLASRWILSRYERTVAEVSRAVEQYRYSEAENLLYEFFWSNYCDWYLEMAKARLNDLDTQKVAYFVLENTLKLLHPFIPFVTEEIYSQLKGEEVLLTLEPWPAADNKFINAEADAKIGLLIELTTSIRNIRSQWNIKQNDQIPCLFNTDSRLSLDLLKGNTHVMQKLCGIAINFGTGADKIHNSVTGVVGDIKYYILLSGLVDLAKEKARIREQITQQEQAAAAIEARLSNDGFLKKAPPEVVEKDRGRMKELRSKNAELEKALKSLA